MADPFIGEVRIFAGTFAPRNWAFCDGQLLDIAQNTALFSIVGTTYGGDGRTNFGLPDLRGRVVIGPGSGPGLTPRTLGETGGATEVTLTGANMPIHNHGSVGVHPVPADEDEPQGNLLAASPGVNLYAAPNNLVDMAPTSLTPTGGSPSGGTEAHSNLQPSLTVNYIIALIGAFPSRN